MTIYGEEVSFHDSLGTLGTQQKGEGLVAQVSLKIYLLNLIVKILNIIAS